MRFLLFGLLFPLFLPSNGCQKREIAEQEVTKAMIKDCFYDMPEWKIFKEADVDMSLSD